VFIANLSRYLWAIALSILLAGSGLNLAIAAPSGSTTPESTSTYTTAQLDRGDELRTQAFTATNQGDFATAEKYWTELVELFPENPAIWSNRGNSRVSQLKLTEAVADFDRSIQLAPQLTDAYLNRGAAWEGLKEWDKAIADYQHILAVDPNDAMAYNNLGNAYAGRAEWEKAKNYYFKATELEPGFAFARANYAIALYQVGDRPEAIRQMKNIVRKYRDFPDVRAALTAALWQDGQRGEAESNWIAVIGLDSRYKDLEWVKNNRRWPPVMVSALDSFLHLR
jgi:tetratricopeptide (TPR) repeat protein